MLWSDAVPHHVHRDASGKTTDVTIIAGPLHDITPPSPPPDSWASRPDADLAIWTIKMEPNATWTIPAAKAESNRVLYVFTGSVTIEGKRIENSGVRLSPTVSVEIAAGDAPVDMLLLQGKPIGEPVVQYGPFVMNTKQEIQQAFADYQKTRFGGWPWDADAPVLPREQARFARHPDGRVEKAR
jgi:hypothetical protein